MKTRARERARSSSVARRRSLSSSRDVLDILRGFTTQARGLDSREKKDVTPAGRTIRAPESVARVAMARTASPDELATLIPRRSAVSGDAATEYFEEESRDASARRRFNIFVALASIGAVCVSVGLTTDMIGHTSKFRTAMQKPRLGVRRWTPLPPWTPNVPMEEVNTPALAYAEMDQVKLEGRALEAAKKWSHEDSFPTFPASRYLDGDERVRRKLETPVYVIAIADDAKDQAKASKLVTRFERTFDLGGAGAAKGDTNGTKNGFVQIQDAVYAAAWPKTIELAEEAVETLNELRPVGSLHWFANLAGAQKRADRMLPPGSRHIAHHVGCLFSHARMWRLHQKYKNKWTIVFESDGLWYLTVPVGALQSVVDNAPTNADVIFLKTKNEHTGQFVKQWPVGKDMIYMYAQNRMHGGAGLAGYMLGPKFTEKIYEHIVSHNGADMVDAWLLINVCSHGDERSTNGGRKNRLNCYHVQQGAKPPHAIGGYLPEWYGVDRTARDTDNWAEWLRNEKDKGAYDAARVERMEAWRNGAEQGKYGKANDQKARAEKRRIEARQAAQAAAQAAAEAEASSDATESSA